MFLQATFCILLKKSPFGGNSGSKGLAVGAGAGFIGGAVAGVAPVSVYHHFLQYKSLISCKSKTVCYKRGFGGMKSFSSFVSIEREYV